MFVEELQELGLNRNEATIYVDLVKLGRGTGGQLIKITGFHRNIVYDNLEKLADKGLVSYITEKGRKTFIANSPETLKDFVTEKQDELDKQEQLATTLAKEISHYANQGTSHHEAIIIKGTYALKQELEKVFQESNYLSYGAPERSTTIMGGHYWKAFSRKMSQHKVTGKLLFNESNRQWADNIRTKNHNIRFLKKGFEPLTQTIIYGTTTLIIVWLEKPITTIIRNKELSESYEQFFELLWKEGKQ